MKQLLTLIFSLSASLLPLTQAHASLWMPSIFDNNMVLQQQSECKLWGTATPGKVVDVHVSWSKLRQCVTAGKDGKWSISIQTPMASYDAHNVTVVELADGNKKAADTKIFENVLIGEVWLCAGQSNMEMPMKGFPSQPIEGGPMDILHSKDANLHLFQAKRVSRPEPIDTITGQWGAAEPELVRNFSATAYYFGRELRRMLDVPVGLIVTAWGGSSCESWMDREHVKQFVHENSPFQIPNSAADIKSPNRTPTVLYNGMLHPIIGYGIKGAIWYQGEDNVQRYQDYAQQMETMVGLWREQWGVGQFPFFFCQIAPYDYSIINWTVNSALLREQQLIAESRIPNCGMAVLMDAGIEKGIHPPKKNIAGERLAMLALVNTYGVKGVTAQSARFKQAEFKDGAAYVSFENDKMNVYSSDMEFASKHFELAGEDRVFHPATMDLYKRKVIKITSPEVPNPVAVRYAFHDWVVGDLFCDGLPLSSFRSDDWPVAERTTDSTEKKDYDKQR